MCFYWIQDRVSQGQFAVHWQKGSDNLADYFTKHHPPAHHILMRPIYIHTSNLAHTIASEWKGVLIQDPGLVESRYPVSAIQSYNVHAGQQSGYIPFEHCHLGSKHGQQRSCSPCRSKNIVFCIHKIAATFFAVS
jgi:cephalosporin-C deacetylase-like acetyl esterase